MPPKFIYFDLGKVLLHFDVDVMCRQMGAAAGVTPERIREVVVDGGLQLDYESGRISSRQFYEQFCRTTGSPAGYEALLRAGSDIFTLNYSMVPVVAQLAEAGHPLGILSNTCEGHWNHCAERYTILRESFRVWALSYEIGACKPDPAIFCRAAELADCEPSEIFYTDDTQGHVNGARAAGFDAVLYTTTPRLAAELRSRGVRFNY